MKYMKTIFCAIFLAIAFSVAADAATLTVINTNDSGAGSLRQAVADASAGDTINFNLAGCPCTITLTSAQLLIGKPLNIVGPGADQLSISGNNARRVFFIRSIAGRFSISGVTITNGAVNDFGGGIGAESNTFVTISNSVISNNSATGGAGVGFGGGVFADAGSVVSILNSTVSDNSASSSGGGIGTSPIAGGAAEIVVSNSSVSNNTARFGGAAVFLNTSNSLTAYNTNFNNNTTTSGLGGAFRSNGNLILRGGTVNSNSITNAGDGGGIYSSGALSLTGVTVSNNSTSSGEGGGIYSSGAATIANGNISNNVSQTSGGGIVSSNALTMSNTTVSGNNTTGDGGGINSSSTANITMSTISGNGSSAGSGGGINNTSALTITNSTISSNTNAVGVGAGISNGANSTVEMINSTVAFNASQFRGGGVFNNASGLMSFSVRSSIIAKNTAQNRAPDAGGTFFSQGFNLIGTGSDATGFTNGTKGDIVGGGGGAAIDPLLGPLNDNGGLTKTHALLNGSPAIDAGNSGVGITTDQRGNQRFFDLTTAANAIGGNLSDIGAYEFMATTAAAISITGKITTQDGRGIGKAKITLESLDGQSTTVVSNGFGNFQFENIESGQTYVIRANSKQYTFDPQVFTVFDEVTDLHLTALKPE